MADTPDPRPTARSRARERTMRRIIALGNAQLAEHGPEQLSVREIARGLGMVSSAVYRYVVNRDELLTLLLVDAFDDLADAVEAAIAEVSAADPAERFTRLAHAVRSWAIVNPARWALLYGTPVRGYAAPAEMTTGPGTRVLTRLLEVVAEVDGAPAGPELGATLAAALERGAHELGTEVSAWTALRATALWSGLVGVVNGELTEQYGAQFAPVAEELFAAQVEVLRGVLGPERGC
ncbi:TetR/AcrR family transcriptional regulator [Saccharopolyspora cebuensis]